MKNDMTLDIIYKVKADLLGSLSHPVRLKIIEALKSREKSVGALMKELGVQQSNLSRHLLTLRDAGILKSRHEGTTVYYGIQDYEIFRVLRPISMMLRKKFKKSEHFLSTLGKS